MDKLVTNIQLVKFLIAETLLTKWNIQYIANSSKQIHIAYSCHCGGGLANTVFQSHESSQKENV